MRSGGELIREARRRAGISQQELAERLGTTQSVIARWETGRRSPTVETLYKAVRACGLELSMSLGTPDPEHEMFIRENRRLAPGERLDQLVEQVAGLQDLVSNMKPSPGRTKGRTKKSATGKSNGAPRRKRDG